MNSICPFLHLLPYLLGLEECCLRPGGLVVDTPASDWGIDGCDGRARLHCSHHSGRRN